MDATATLHRSTPLVQLARAALVTATAGYLALSFSLFARRLAGGLAPLDASLLIMLAICVPAAVLLVRMLWANLREQRRSGADWFICMAPSASALLLAAAVSVPGSSPPALAALWLAIVGVEATFVSRDLVRRRRRSTVAAHIRGADAPRSPRTTQSIVRETTADGETISGELLASFRAGERTVFLHVAFCPPLASAPTIECEQLDGPEAEIKISQAQIYGARFDVRLNEASDEPLDVLVSFAAVGRISNPSVQSNDLAKVP